MLSQFIDAIATNGNCYYMQEARSRILYQISVERPMLKPVVFQFLLHES